MRALNAGKHQESQRRADAKWLRKQRLYTRGAVQKSLPLQ